jgi:hypothetical protein
MAGRQNPPHDRVTLSYEERRSLAQLESAFAGRSYSRRRRLRAGARRRIRVTTRQLSMVLCVAGPSIVLTGMVFVIASLMPATVVLLAGVVLVGVGVVPAARSPWLRSRVACRRSRDW